jgi:prohibitin 2
MSTFLANTEPFCLQSIIIRAKGEARSAELIGESLRKNKGFLELRRLEAAREIATILSQSQNKVMLDSESLLLNGEHLHVNL